MFLKRPIFVRVFNGSFRPKITNLQRPSIHSRYWIAFSNNVFTSRYIFALLFVVVHSLTLTGQELLTRVRILSVEDGLSGRFINDIDRDDRGFIWILTNEAVNRFDGTTFKSYPKAAYGLSANIYDRIFTDTDGYLWLVNYAFGKNSQRITRYVRHIDRFDPAGELIVPGLDRSFSEAGVSVDSLTAIAAASDHRLYLGFRNGDIYLWDSGLTKIVSTGLYLNYIFPPPDDQSPVWCISRGRLASFNRAGNLLAEQKVPSLTGLRKLSDSRFLLFHHNERYFFDLNTAKLDSTLEVAPGIAVNGTDFTAFSSDPLGRTWCFKPGEFSVADPQKGWVIQGRGLTSEPQVGLPDDVFWDSQTTCWINFKSAVGVMIVEPSPFSRLFAGQGNSMRGIAPVNDSVLVAFSYSGSYLFNRNTLQPYPYPGQGLKVGIGAVADRDGNVLVGMHSDHVLRINLTKNERQRYPILFEEGNLVIETYPFIDRKGKVWLGSNQGLFYLDKTEQVFKRYVFKNPFEALNSANLHFFLETDEGTWIAGEKGLVFMDKTERIRNWYRGFDEDMINGLAIDPEGVFWIATRGAGLLKWKPDRGMIARWNTGNGLSNNFVNGVYPDRHGYLWLPTNYGLDRLDPGSGEVNIYLEQDGIAHNEFNFASGYQDEAGNFYFGGLNGLTVFDPDKVAQFHTESQPALEITQLLVMNSENGTMVNRTADLTRTGGIVMRPGEKALQLRFALLDYGRIGKQRYAYRVEELDKEWTYLNDGFISLNQLPYGRYKLRIKGLGRGGEWSVNELLIPLTVERPFYRTAWFLVVCLLLLAAAMRIYFLFRFQQFNKEKANLERQIADRTARIMLQNEELKSLNSIKDRMFSIIGHELRGPLVYFRGISLKLARLIEAGDYQRLGKFGKSMDKAALSVGDMLDNLLNWGVIQNKHIPYKPMEVRVDELLNHTLAPYAAIAEMKGVGFTFCPSPRNRATAFVDQNALRLIVQNLVNNAVKFTPPGGRICVKCTEADPWVEIAVEDSGIGMPPGLTEHIFTLEAESRTGTDGEKGTGLGLLLCRELVKMNHGKIDFESRPGKGTTFVLTVPAREIIVA